MRNFTASTLLLALLSTTALARTDLSGCTSSNTVVNGGASVLWYVPGTGEICEFLDCGGGRAPPKTTVPGCPQYHGTASYSPSYLPGYGPNAVASMTTSAAASVSEILPTQTSFASSGSLVVDASSSSSAAQVTGSSSSHSITTAPTGVTQITGKSTATSVSGSKGSSAASAASSAATGAATALAAVGKDVVGLAIGVVAGLAML